MPITGELTLTYSTYRRIALAPTGARAWIPRAIGALLLLCAAVLIFLDRSTGALPGLTIAGLALLLGLDLLVALGWSRTRRLTTAPWRYEFTPTTVGIHTPGTTVTVRWEAISRHRIRRHAWVLTVAATGRPLAIPRAAFSPESAHQVDHFLHTRHRTTSPPAPPSQMV